MNLVYSRLTKTYAIAVATMAITRSQKRQLTSVSAFVPSSSRKAIRTGRSLSRRAKGDTAYPPIVEGKTKVVGEKSGRGKKSSSKSKARDSSGGTKKTSNKDTVKQQYNADGKDDIVVASNLLLSLPDDVIIGELRKRPSKRNRSPYVGDVWLEAEQREAIVHLPNLDMGGKCVPGAKLLMKPARDRKGNLVGKDAVNPKYGTPKCEFIAQLLRYDESDLGYEPAWVGAHPSLGEKIAEELVGRNLLGPAFPKVKSYKREVRNVGGTDMRADFLIEHEDPTLSPRILEVKTVVDTDYSPSSVPDRAKCVFTNDEIPYRRTGIFPWGSSNQKGPDGEPVVSARAIKHVRELTRMVVDESKDFDCTVLFVVIRHDAKAFRPNVDACPSFARYIREAKDAGVQVLAKQVVWGEEKDVIGQCFEGELLDIVWP